MLGEAIALASGLFRDVTDKGGKPYILHCLAVMNGVDQSDDELMIIAVLHDVPEDTDMSISILRDCGFTERVVSALDCLTHRNNESYDDYIHRVATNSDAIMVKLADLRHNSNIMRMKGLRNKDFIRLEKYHRSYNFLTQQIQ